MTPELDAAYTWAGALSLSHGAMTLAEIQEAWNGPDGQKHRAALKADTGAGPGLLQQLSDYVRAHVLTLKRQKEAA